MALPPLIKHIYNYGNDEIIRRGKKIFLEGGVQLMSVNEDAEHVIMRVRNDLYHNYYTVNIYRYTDEAALNLRCQCPYNMGEICRHEAAALFQLNELINTHRIHSASSGYNQQHSVVRMRQIDLKQLRMYTSEVSYDMAERVSLHYPAKIDAAQDEKVVAHFNLGDEVFKVILKRNDDKTFDTSCNCDETSHPLCTHKAALFLQLINNYGAGYFDTIRNWDTQKNKLLQLYGYSINDNLDGKFEFHYIDGKPFLKVLDASIKKVNQQEKTFAYQKKEEPIAASKSSIKERLGIVLNINEKKYPYFSVEIIEGELNDTQTKFIDRINKVDTSKYINLDKYTPDDKELLLQLRKISATEINKYVAKNSPFGDVWDNIYDNAEDDNTTLENKHIIIDYVWPKLTRLLLNKPDTTPLYILPKGKALSSANIELYTEGITPVEPQFNISLNKNKLHIQTQLESANGEVLNLGNAMGVLGNSMLYYEQNALMYNRHIKSAQVAESLYSTDMQKPWQEVLQNDILPLNKKYNLVFDDKLLHTEKGEIQNAILYLSETNENFVMQPAFLYTDGTEVPYNDDINYTIIKDGKVCNVHRNKEGEEETVNKILTLGKNVHFSTTGKYIYINGKYALAGNWFYKFFDQAKDWQIILKGTQSLQRFKIKQSKPKTTLIVTSGMDWFDADVNVEFEGVNANLADIKKALIQKNNFVTLSDGTIGLLPEEWLEKYSLMFKMAESKNNKLRISKYNFAVIDELYDSIDDEKIKEELTEKKNNLLNPDSFNGEKPPLPKGLHADLRNYQLSGFHWLSYLTKIKWGGLLADDMGLGKTVQALTVLQHYVEENKNCLALIVCPTTLVFNWQNEIMKFTPNLTYIVHHGSTRTNKKELLEQYNIIITTYGTLRSDIELLNKLNFDYAILDESQAIKNPTSKVAKAAMLLHASHRVALSGTPMQNNSFDLYSQINFLNPGMLGTKEFFKEQFAVPIDKLQDDTTKAHLRKLVYPFLLRRKKEQVAKDLPEKIEIVLYCEMESEQRKIYDAFKNSFRAQILGTIEEKGIERSQIAILQGLTKLRQICDSPAILNEDVKYPNHSAKLDELVREIEENIGDHKVLIFSQFLGMLSLIREALDKHNIRHQYFDGSYSSTQRQNAVNDFQNNPECRAFLISLKAGGTGLNLTAADYVYIVDPWWNPAVEQQAIDRTHRIGQDKNIFAYRLICKDSIEEKIMELKNRKSKMVKDIIADDDNFVKQLSKDDLIYLLG